MASKLDDSNLLLPVPRPAAGTPDARAAAAFQDLIAAAKKMKGQPDFAGYGSITSTGRRVSYHKLWVNPATALDYTQDEIGGMADSLRAIGQKQPIIVAPFTDPRAYDAGGSGGELVIIDGALRYTAMPLAGIDLVEVTIRPLRTVWDVMVETVTAKAGRTHTLSDEEKGTLCHRLIRVNAIERERDAAIPRLTQLALAEMLGLTQGTVSKYLALVRLPEEVQTLLDSGSLSHAQATELVHAPPDVATHVAQTVAAQQQHTGESVPSREVRRLVRQQHDGRRSERTPDAPDAPDAPDMPDMPDMPDTPHFTFAGVPRPMGLWPAPPVEAPAPVAIGAHIHDLALWLDAVRTQTARERRPVAPAVEALYQALAHPAFGKLVDDLARSSWNT